ncbi:condensation domain-containing protein [Streptomyces tagetis]|uniref:Condensation domain-containing protein n=1 Tax=Streptomyces tagetis TaxID=2820809 RepID=A0A940XIU9_9ACTN|nr:condensation domain-containing protein [Streptomyces sp. RG38]MBQ0825395.1 hypothetical protein [Streptomyces sp. RG38]
MSVSEPETPTGTAGSGPHALTWGQKGIYEHLRCNGYAMYGALVPSLWHLPEPCDAETVRSVLDLLVRRHECLRTVYLGPSGAPADPSVPTREVVQRVEAPRPVPVSVVRCPVDRVDARLEELVTGLAETYVFDPAEPSAMSAVLVETDDGVRAAAVGISHMAVDGVGEKILEREFRHCLRLARAGRPMEEDLPLVRHPRELLTDEADASALRRGETTRRYFRTVLRQTPRAFLTTGRPRSELDASQVTAASWSLRASLDRLAEAGHLPAQTALLTLVMALVAARAGERRSLFRVLFERRHWFPRGESYVAPQTLAALVHLETPAAGTVLDLLRRGRAAAMAGYVQADYDTCDLVDLQDECAERIGADTDGFAMFNCGIPPAGTASAAVDASRPTEVLVDRRGDVNLDMQFAFACGWDVVPGAVGVDIRQNDRLVGSNAAAFLRRLERFAACAAEDPGAPLDRALRATATEGA